MPFSLDTSSTSLESEIVTVNIRIEQLETQLMFQDETIEALNQVIIQQQSDFSQLKKIVDNLKSYLADLPPNELNSANECPPHY
jgi:SlyX protein